MRVKRYFSLILSIILLSSIVGCTISSKIITIGNIDSHGNEITGKYEKFSGYYAKRIKLRENQSLQINFEETTDKGNIRALITDSKKNEILELSQNGENITFNPPKKGMYYIRVEGKEHRGSFNIEWEKINKD